MIYRSSPIISKLSKPAKFSDFKGGYNLLRTIQEEKAESQIDPSLGQVRNLVSELVGMPLGVGISDPKKLKTYLFYGPSGSGKSLMVKALASETN